MTNATRHLTHLTIAAAVAFSTVAPPALAQPGSGHVLNGIGTEVPDGTEILLETTDELSSKVAEEGDRVTFKVKDDVEVDGVVVFQKGAAAKGIITKAEQKGFLGKAGKLSFRVNHVKSVDGQSVDVRTSKGAQGKDSVTGAIVLTVVLGPVGLLKRGKDVKIPEGTEVRVFTDEDAVIRPARDGGHDSLHASREVGR